MAEEATLLAVSADPGDSKALAAILETWTVKTVQTCAEALAALRRSKCAAVLCEKDLPDGSWRDLLRSASHFGQEPPLIVMSRAADESLWVDVLAHGGFDLIAKPLDPAEVRRVMGCASSNSHPLHAVAQAC
jgi:DNA-binding NtrC family response regulator